MVGTYKKRGFHDWLAQRITALLIAIYTIFLVVFLLCHPAVTHAQWYGLFHNEWMRVATIVVLFSVLWHAWIGLWTVLTDYVPNKAIRLFLEVIICLVLILYLVWCISILWS